MPFTAFHLGIAYLASLPIRKRINLLSFFIGTTLMDIEGVLTIPDAFASCAGAVNLAQCTAEYPSHLFLHSIPGIIFIIAPIASYIVYLRLKKQQWKKYYFSAVLGGVIHLALDSTVHRGADAISWFYPYGQTSFYLGHEIWILLGTIGIVAFFVKEDIRNWYK